MTETSFKPGCFGSPLAHGSAHVCGACPWKQACKPEAEARAIRLKTLYGLVVPTNPPRTKRPPQAPVIPPIQGLPAKGIEVLKVWAQRGIDLKRAVMTGTNPFEGSDSFMRIVLSLLLHGGFTRESLQTALASGMSWSAKQARAHMDFAVRVLLGMGAAIERGGQIVPYNHQDQKEAA
jgi:hypothetical protein